MLGHADQAISSPSSVTWRQSSVGHIELTQVFVKFLANQRAGTWYHMMLSSFLHHGLCLWCGEWWSDVTWRWVKKKFGDRPSRVWSSQACICSAMLVPFTSRFSRSWCALRQADRTSLMSLQKGLPWNGAIVVIMRWFSFSPFPIHSSLLWVPQHDLKSLMAVLPQRAVHLGSKPLQRQGHQNSPWNIQDQGTVWLQYDYSQWTLETVQVHLEATFQPIFQQPQLPLHRAEAALRFAPVLRMVHAAQNAVVYGVYGPTAPQLPHAWSLMGKMMMNPFQGTLYPYDPISGHTSRCTTGSWRTPCQAPSSRPSRSPRPCKRANGSPSTSIYGSKWDVSYLSI